MDFFSKVLKKSDEYNLIEENIRQGDFPLQVTGLSGATKAHLVNSLCKNLKKNGVVVCQSEYDAKKIYEDLSFFCGEDVVYYPAKEIEYYEALAKSNEYINERLLALKSLINSDNNTIFVLSVDALLQFTIDFDSYINSVFEISVDDEIKILDLSKRLVSLGYTHEDMVEGKGQFSIRGGIVDVFSPEADNPYRIEFFGDFVDSIREFDAIEQTSIENVEKITISAATEEQMTDNKASVITYFNQDSLIFFDEPVAISERAENYLWDINETVKSLIEKEAY